MRESTNYQNKQMYGKFKDLRSTGRQNANGLTPFQVRYLEAPAIGHDNDTDSNQIICTYLNDFV